MKNASGTFVLSFVGFAAMLAPVSAADTALVPRHTPVAVVTTSEIRVGGMGDSQAKKVEFEVYQDVVVGGKVVAKKGDLVEGHYTASRNVTTRMLGASVSQEIALDIDDAVNFCGDTLKLQFEHTFRGEGKAGPLTFGAHVKDAVFPKGQVLITKTDRVMKNICAERSTATALAMPSNAIVSDEDTAGSTTSP